MIKTFDTGFKPPFHWVHGTFLTSSSQIRVLHIYRHVLSCRAQATTSSMSYLCTIQWRSFWILVGMHLIWVTCILMVLKSTHCIGIILVNLWWCCQTRRVIVRITFKLPPRVFKAYISEPINGLLVKCWRWCPFGAFAYISASFWNAPATTTGWLRGTQAGQVST